MGHQIHDTVNLSLDIQNTLIPQIFLECLLYVYITDTAVNKTGLISFLVDNITWPEKKNTEQVIPSTITVKCNHIKCHITK